VQTVSNLDEHLQRLSKKAGNKRGKLKLLGEIGKNQEKPESKEK
jgi:hypothetical protein